jgi:membrane-bound inhibitor of C-type lysozyme
MNKYIAISILILLISGCVEADSKTVYYSKQSNETVTFYKDNTVTAINPNTSISGAYRIDGDYIIMTWPPFGTVGKVKKSGNIFTDEKTGETWEEI